MKKILLRTSAAVIFSSGIVFAGGYKIPETSLNSLALSAANVAYSQGSDAAYYNPANMAFMQDENSLNANIMYIGIEPTHFKGSGSMAGVEIDAEAEAFIVPSIHYVSNEISGMRFGLSIVSPGGLTKRWTDSPAVDKAEQFTLQVIEVNPTVAIKLNDEVSVALGLRALHSSGIVKSTSTASRDLEGESYDFGYNVALSYKPTSDIHMALTYRSNVDLSVEGNAKLYVSGTKVYDGGASVSVPLPGLLNLALAYTLPSKTTVEFVYERNFWSSYKELDFDYVSTIPLAIQPYFDDPIAKNWKDSNSYRLGVTQNMDALTLMAGIVYDETPVPEQSASFELPDSNSLAVSFGGRYQINEKLDAGLAALYSVKEDRSIANDDLSGEFSNGKIFLVSAGIEYKF
ncbi:porin [bacterium]|nr:porin [bacterium]MBU1989718.1 porin [bacterium]